MGGGSETLLEFTEGFFSLGRPLELNMWRGHCMQRGGNSAEVVNKTSLKVGKPKKLLNQLMVSGCVPIGDSTDLVWFHPDVILGND